MDESDIPGNFILTGSHNFQVSSLVNQSLAGRSAMLQLLPFGMEELAVKDTSLEELALHGFYPRVQAHKLSPQDFYPAYIGTYLERDVRQLINVTDLSEFQRFLKLTAGSVGRELNFSRIAADVGKDSKTIKAWLSVLEASNLIFLVPPFYKNLRKRVVKSAKLYFIEVGIVCSLLGINTTQQLSIHPLKGEIIENLVMAEIYKAHAHRAIKNQLYFF